MADGYLLYYGGKKTYIQIWFRKQIKLNVTE